MSRGQLGNSFLLLEATFGTAEGYNTIRLLCSLLGYLTASEGMIFFIESYIAGLTAFCPVYFAVILGFCRATYTVLSLGTVVLAPLTALGTNSVCASVFLLGAFGTAIGTHITVGAGINAPVTFVTFNTKLFAIGTDLSAIGTDIVNTVSAIMTVTAHFVGTIYTYAAIGAELIHTARAFATILTDVFRTVTADNTAILTDLGTFSALHTVLTPHIIGTFPTQVTGGTKFVKASRTFFTAIGTDVGTVFTAVTAYTGNRTFTAQMTNRAEGFSSGTIHTGSAILTQLIRASGTDLTAFFTYYLTVCASVSAGAGHTNTGYTQCTLVTEITVSHTAVTETAIHTYLTVGALVTFLSAIGTNGGTQRTTLSAIANIVYAVFTNAAIITKMSLSSCTFSAYPTFGAKLLVGTV